VRSNDRPKTIRSLNIVIKSLNIVIKVFKRSAVDGLFKYPNCIEYMTLTLTLTLTLTNYKIEYIIWDRYNLNLKVIGLDMGQTLVSIVAMGRPFFS
jgi:hypothetical protein